MLSYGKFLDLLFIILEDNFIFLSGLNITISALLPTFKLPASSLRSLAGFVLNNSTSFEIPNFFSFIIFNVRGKKLSNPIEPVEAASKGNRLLSVS